MRNLVRTIFACTVLCGLTLTPLSAHAQALRVVSLNPCLDTILVHVAAPEQIAGLSHYARDPDSSTISDIAQRYPVTYESAEEVIALSPDLVLTSQHSSLSTRHALQRLGIQTELFDVPETIAASIAQIRRVAALIGRDAAGAALIADIDAALARTKAEPERPRVTALIFQRNGFAAGRGTLVDEVMTHVGFENVIGDFGFGKWGYVSLERLIAAPPQVLLAGEVAPGTPTWADRVARHPALMRLTGQTTRAVFPDRLLYCGGPVLMQSAHVLAAARVQARHSRQVQP